jgi:hypothetical protein
MPGVERGLVGALGACGTRNEKNQAQNAKEVWHCPTRHQVSQWSMVESTTAVALTIDN